MTKEGALKKINFGFDKTLSVVLLMFYVFVLCGEGMNMPSRARELKEKWMVMPDVYFATKTFGELWIGQKFISLPIPGDNNGHGGFRGTHFVFTKIRQKVIETEGGLLYHPRVLHGRAKDNRGVSIDFPHSMAVIPVA